MWTEICQIHGLDSRSSLCRTKNIRKDRCGLEGGLQTSRQQPDMIQDHEDRIAERERIQFDGSLQFGAQVYSDAPSDENSGCKSSGGERMGEAQKVASMATGEGTIHEICYSGSTKREKMKVHFATLMDTCHLKNAELELKHQKIQRTSRAPR